MTHKLSSPFTQPMPDLPIREGAPPLARPTKEEMDGFPHAAQHLLTTNWVAQQPHLNELNLSWLAGRHVLLAGATGPGLGGALATAILGQAQAASLTIVARDLTRSLGYETGKAMQAQAEAAGWGNRFHWLNSGMALEGKALAQLVEALQEAKADRVIYINTVAAALSGLLPNMPTVFVKDADETGPFQWQLTPLSEKEIEITRFVMGEMAVQFPHVLAQQGIPVELSAFADWRGSLDKISRDPAYPEYGRQGAYSTSLYLPKVTIQTATRAVYHSQNRMIDIFFPMMRTRALSFIPGGLMMAGINETLMRKENIRYRDVPELAVGMLDRIGRALAGDDNPFPRLDAHDAHLDEWMFEVIARLNNDENSDFYYKRWV